MFICFTNHARARLQERYGLLPTPGLAWFLVRALEVGLPTTAGSLSIWDVPYRGRNLRFVFDMLRREIVTFLPEIVVCRDFPHRAPRHDLWYKGRDASGGAALDDRMPARSTERRHVAPEAR